jgi:hypothetical protein
MPGSARSCKAAHGQFDERLEQRASQGDSDARSGVTVTDSVRPFDKAVLDRGQHRWGAPEDPPLQLHETQGSGIVVCS